jgi:hypothetical protein
MTRPLRLLAWTMLAIATVTFPACSETGGIGVGVPAGGARWGGGTSGPGVIVSGGPVYR